MEEKDEIRLQIFNGDAYDKWKFRLKLYLQMKKCNEVVERETRPSTITEEAWNTNEIKAKNYIVNSVSNTQLELILNEETAREMILKFDSIYGTKSSANKLLSKKRLLELKMNESEDPMEFLNKFEAHINDLIRCAETVTKVDKLNYLLLSLPQSYSYIVDIIDALPEHEKSVEYVKSKLLLEQKKRETDRGNGQTFNTRTEKRKCYKCGKTGHLQYNCRSVGGDTGWRTNHSRHPLALRGQEQGQYNGRGQYRGREVNSEVKVTEVHGEEWQAHH
ncbi:unnamed protein product [Arctia plantaginis]|uniref:CCHC-type domain-containing protein n=1 Tax=Arctia plantaginis TaxID=874455 RepID=A0A8S1AVR9_ARCPL|nr:unnamed protein product [Arctia plantaginis]